MYNEQYTDNIHKQGQTTRYGQVISEYHRHETQQQSDDVEHLAWSNLLHSTLNDR